MEIKRDIETARHDVMQEITREGLFKSPYVAARGGVESATFSTEGTRHHHSTIHATESQRETDTQR